MTDLLRISINGDGQIVGSFNAWIAAVILVVAFALVLLLPKLWRSLFGQDYEIDQLEIGVGSGKVKFRPNNEDLQIAYKLWVEL